MLDHSSLPVFRPTTAKYFWKHSFIPFYSKLNTKNMNKTVQDLFISYFIFTNSIQLSILQTIFTNIFKSHETFFSSLFCFQKRILCCLTRGNTDVSFPLIPRFPFSPFLSHDSISFVYFSMPAAFVTYVPTTSGLYCSCRCLFQWER